MTCKFCDLPIGASVSITIANAASCANCSAPRNDVGAVYEATYDGHVILWGDIYAQFTYAVPKTCHECGAIIAWSWVLCEDGGAGKELLKLVEGNKEGKNDSHHD